MNRKERRSKKATKSDSDPDIPLSLPPTTDPRKPAKTLYEIAAERQAELQARTNSKNVDPIVPTKENVVNVAIGPDGKIKRLDGSDVPEIQSTEMEPLADTVMLASSLSALHFTLEALTVHQYAEELLWSKIFTHTMFMAFPVLLLLVHFAHGHLVHLKLGQRATEIIKVVKQVVFVGIANVAGCYLVYLTNDRGLACMTIE